MFVDNYQFNKISNEALFRINVLNQDQLFYFITL